MLTPLFALSQSVGLVMSGGGARGLSHIGVIKALEENDIPVDYVTGTSMGAIVAGLYASGYSADEMINVFKSNDFENWLSGNIDEKQRYYALSKEPTSELFLVKFNINRDKKIPFKINLPTSIISPYPMDIAFFELFSGATAACKSNFDNLFVPFRCVSADINAHKPFISRNGDLGMALRASMTFPLAFKAIMIDSALLLDGGIYNNFPWDVMENDFNPDFIIGSKCSDNEAFVNGENIFDQIKKMMMNDTDYTMPEEKSIRIDTKFDDVDIFEFSKIDRIVEAGYQSALKSIDSIKQRISARRTADEVAKKRKIFKANISQPRLKNINVAGNKIADREKNFIRKMINQGKNNPDSTMSMERFKDRYFKIVETGVVSSLFPAAVYDSITKNFDVKLQVTLGSNNKIAFGANLSSSLLNQAYFGFEHKYWAKAYSRYSVNFHYGKLYSAAQVGVRRDYPFSLPVFWEQYFRYNHYDYYESRTDFFIEDEKPVYLKHQDMHYQTGGGYIVNRNTIFRIDATAGINKSNYYQNRSFLVTDTADIYRLNYFASNVEIVRNNLNYIEFPTDGRKWQIKLQFITGNGKYTPGNTSILEKESKSKSIFSIKLYEEKYFNLSKNFSLGYLIEGVYSQKASFSSYYPTLFLSPSFQPTQHSKTLFLENFRANSYVAAGIMPVYSLMKSVYFKGGLYVFQPYRELKKGEKNKIIYGDKFKSRSFMGYGTFVWQSPIGPLSSTLYYYDGYKNKFIFSINFGYLIFNRKGIEF
ncbi:MAG: patatin-like phospholipase family protein [Prevotellaceae bacterium]|jgi:NTE family protein|nr:patatin-like phospholipase family protein [Prevotellaceae bacterium]